MRKSSPSLPDIKIAILLVLVAILAVVVLLAMVFPAFGSWVDDNRSWLNIVYWAFMAFIFLGRLLCFPGGCGSWGKGKKK